HMKVLLQHAIIRSNNLQHMTREDMVDVFYGNKKKGKNLAQ
ncbi:2165_t:CDS:1, partial [Ambispora gerdemannii]